MARYLLQVAFACGPPHAGSAGCDQLEVIAEIIGDLGGQIEHHWLSAGEFDAVIIVETMSHGMAFDLAIATHPAVKATRTTALRTPDDPFEDYESWCGPEIMRVVAGELADAGITLLKSPALPAGQDATATRD